MKVDKNYDHAYHIKPVKPNVRGVRVVVKIMKELGKGYDAELFDITQVIEDRYVHTWRDRYDINSTLAILEMMKYIKDNELLSRESGDIQ